MKVILRMLIVMQITAMLHAAQTPDPYSHIAAPIVKRPCSAPPGFVLDECSCTQCCKPDAQEQSHDHHHLSVAPSAGAFRRIQPDLSVHLNTPTNLETPTPEPKPLLPSLPTLKQKSTFSSDKLRSLQAYFVAKDEETKAEQKKPEEASVKDKEPKEQKSRRRNRRKNREQREKAAKLQAIRNSLVQLASNGDASKVIS